MLDSYLDASQDEFVAPKPLNGDPDTGRLDGAPPPLWSHRGTGLDRPRFSTLADGPLKQGGTEMRTRFTDSQKAGIFTGQVLVSLQPLEPQWSAGLSRPVGTKSAEARASPRSTRPHKRLPLPVEPTEVLCGPHEAEAGKVVMGHVRSRNHVAMTDRAAEPLRTGARASLQSRLSWLSEQ